MTKMRRSSRLCIRSVSSQFVTFDPFGDFDMIFGATKLNLRCIDVPIRYAARTYGETQISRFRQTSTLQVGLHEGTQSVGMAVEIGYFFQVLDCSGHVAGIESVTTAQQESMTVAGIER